MEYIEHFSETWSKRWLRLCLVAFGLAIAILHDIFFWNRENGIGFLIFVIIYIIGFLTFLVYTNSLRQKKFLLLLIPILVLSFDVFLYNNVFVSLFVPWIVFILLILTSLLLTLNKEESHPFYFLGIPILRDLSTIIKKIRVMSSDFSWGKGEDRSALYKRILKGFIVALPLLLIFGILFVAADRSFADWFFSLPEKLDVSVVWRVSKIIIMSVLASAFFYEIVSQNHRHQLRNLIVEKFDNVVVSTILACLNALFLLFVVFQFKYFFGSYNYVIGNSLVFSEYAKKGFGEMIFASCLALLILTVVYRSFSHHGSHKVLTMFSSLFLLQTAVIAFSAWRRMDLYQQAYGLTTSRLYGEYFLYYIIAVMLMAVIFLLAKWKFKTFLHSGLALTLIAITVVASLNVDYTIAKENLKQFLVGDKRQDLTYVVRDLSVDAMPAVQEYLSVNPGFVLSIPYFNVQNVSSSLKNKADTIKNHDTFLELNFGVVQAEKVFSVVNTKYQTAFEKAQADFDKKQKEELEFNKKYSELISQRFNGCYQGTLSSSYDCGSVLYLKDKSLVAAYNRQTRVPELYMWQRKGNVNNYQLVKINFAIPDILNFKVGDRINKDIYLLKDATYAYLDFTNHVIKKFRIKELNNQYSLVESS